MEESEFRLNCDLCGKRECFTEQLCEICAEAIARLMNTVERMKHEMNSLKYKTANR